jgi:hypothetical protein
MKQYKDTEYYITEDGKIFRNGKELKPSLTNKGYKTYRACISIGVRKHISIHRAVAELYVSNPHNKPCVNHIDANPLNNHYTNLEWVTHKENTQHMLVTNTMVVGEDYKHTKLTEKDVKWIRDNYIPKHPQFSGTALAKKFNVGNAQISRIINNTRWKHL